VSDAANQPVRIDKWLWAARFFKTRSLAATAVSGGKVHVNGQRTKPARPISIGDQLTIRRGHEEMTVQVRGLSARRGPAAQAALLYQETDTSMAERERQRELRKLSAMATPSSDKRPSKRDRRRILQFTGKR
jgi:ribosome-associated heat shock protein Hsp15